MNGGLAITAAVAAVLVVVLIAAARYGISRGAVVAEARHEDDRAGERTPGRRDAA